MVRVHIDGEYGGGGAAGENVGRCPIRSGMTGARNGDDEDGRGSGSADRLGFPIEVRHDGDGRANRTITQF